MAAKSPTPSAIGAFQTANTFHEGAIRCAEDVEDPVGGVLISADGAAVVNAAFAAELYMKSMALRRDPNVEGHNLEWLFNNALDDRERAVITRNFTGMGGTTEQQMKKEIKRFARAFTDWRYVYEFDVGMISIGALMLFVRSAFFAVRELVPEWGIDPHLHNRLARPPKSFTVLTFLPAKPGETTFVTWGDGPHPNLATCKNDSLADARGEGAVDDKAAPFDINVGSSSDSKDSGAD